MGHDQFVPIYCKALVVDFTGDGRRDISSDDPSDALASTVANLVKNGIRMDGEIGRNSRATIAACQRNIWSSATGCRADKTLLRSCDVQLILFSPNFSEDSYAPNH